MTDDPTKNPPQTPPSPPSTTPPHAADEQGLDLGQDLGETGDGNDADVGDLSSVDDLNSVEMDSADLDEPAITPGGRRKRVSCAVSGKRRPRRALIALDSLRPTLANRIRQDYPNLEADALISRTEVARYRSLYVADLLKAEHGELTEMDRRVAESIANQETLAENIEEEYEDHRTLGERLSDHLASFGGSWAFLISFGLFMVLWMTVNLLRGDPDAFDPYPFILLNLVLSCLAAIQAPIIMMSQKRQEAKDRLHSENDYRVNLKAELEIRHLHEKMDYLLQRQWQRLTEIQQLQLELMQEKKLRKQPRPADG
jgi:uncharacterized membrane protein